MCVDIYEGFEENPDIRYSGPEIDILMTGYSRSSNIPDEEELLQEFAVDRSPMRSSVAMELIDHALEAPSLEREDLEKAYQEAVEEARYRLSSDL